MRLRSLFRPRSAFIAVMLAAGLIASAVPAGAADEAAPAGTLIVKVYGSDGTTMPIVGAEVFVGGAGTPLYNCTNNGGVARFYNVPSGVDLSVATGPAVARINCSNPDFRRPDGKKMYWMAYRQLNQGGGGWPWTQFQVTAGATTTIEIRPRTPNQAAVCGGARVTRNGTNAPDLIIGTPGDDVINTFGGDDVVFGMGGNDTICGGPGADILIGGTGNDWLIGEDGNDTLIGETGDDRLIGNDGADRMIGGEDNDWFWGLGSGGDWAQLRPGSDRLHRPSTEIISSLRFIPF